MTKTIDNETAARSSPWRYQPPAGAFDEMVDADGKLRPHWQHMADFLRGSAPQMLDSLKLETLRRLKEQGVYYNVYEDPAGQRRTWQLDPVPMLLPEHEWPQLEAGLRQRAHLFSLLLQDLYGPQRSLHEGLIPHEVVLRHPEFLRPAMVPPGSGALMSPLTLYAVDLARGPDGTWWVLNDRTQGPSGAGYVLEARAVTKRVLGQSVSDYSIAPLAQFFHQLKRHVVALAPDQQREPTIAVLSSGIGNEVYFEHAYLAAQLGITLVQGDDLTVRSGNVYLRTVDDLRRVDVLIRRVDSSFCDPLSLRSDSMLGVPGLMQAQQLGRIGMANALGSGVLECPALLPFLPALSRAWLGEDLLVPNVATWWCGQDKERKYVLTELSKLVVKRVDRPGQVIFADTLSRKELTKLADAIKATPWAYVGQEHLGFSTTPTLVGQSSASGQAAANSPVEARPLVLRSFLAGNGEHYDVMPGGLTRVGGSIDAQHVSTQSGGWSKDTWLLRRSGSMRDVLRLHPTGQRRQTAAVLTSRAAEHLFWAASYLERSESLLRLANSYQSRYETWLDYGFEADERVLHQWSPLLQSYMPGMLGGDVPPAPDTLRRALLGKGVGSLAYNLHRGLEGIYTVRDLWPLDSWRVIEELEELLTYAERNSDVIAVDQLVHPLLNAMLAFWGASQESLALTQGGLWLHIGRRLERVQNMLLIVGNFCRGLIVGEDATLALETLLEAHGCIVSHRRRYGIELNFLTVWQHLLLEVTNPRSLMHQLEELESLLHLLSKGVSHAHSQFGLSNLEKTMLAVTTTLRLADAREWSQSDTARALLSRVLGELSGRLRQLSTELDNHYFRHTQPFTQFSR
ncbi:MAG: circularly permuted type 2 ATP-grasp protein [Spongiibacteraceae bacterium]